MKKIALLAAAVVLFGSHAVFAADAPKQCINLSFMDNTTILNDSTILVKMKNQSYKRIDLHGPCNGLGFVGFAHTTPSNDLCSTDQLTVREPVPVVCPIKQIVDITPTQADQLKADNKKR
jgi:hypothetical protein